MPAANPSVKRVRTSRAISLLWLVGVMFGVSGATPLKVPSSFAAAPTIPHAALMADRLIETMGVAAKIHYASDRDYALIDPLLRRLGIRYLRDGGSGDRYYQRVRSLSQGTGIRWTMVMDPRDGFTGSTVPDQGVLPILPHLAAIEGPNEWDVQPNLTYQQQAFPEATRRFQTELYQAMKRYQHSDPSIQTQVRSLPILTPALADHHHAVQQGVLPADAGNLHSYPGGTAALPDQGLEENLRSLRTVLPSGNTPSGNIPSGNIPIVVTETGYCNQLTPQGCTGQGGVTERAAAKYANRLYLESFRRGITRTHLYNFSLDEWSLFLRSDGSMKPAYSAVQSLIQILQDPGSAFTPGALDYQLSGDSPELRSLLLQKRNGRFYLILWLNVLSVSPDYHDRDSSRSVKLTLHRPVRQVQIYAPTFQGRSVQQRYPDPKQLILSVPDHPLIVELIP